MIQIRFRMTRATALVALAFLAVTTLAQPQFVRETDRYVLRGTPLEMSWDARTGALTSVVHAKSGVTLLENAERPFDLHTDQGWTFRIQPDQATRLGAIVLDGEWDFRLEDGEQRTIKVPGRWEDQGFNQAGANDPDPAWEPYNGTAYYTRRFDVPDGLRGKDLLLRIQRVDDFDWVTINGQEIGHTGDEVEQWWATPRSYNVPAGVLKATNNVIQVKVYDRGGEGGIIGSVLLATAEQLEALEKPCLQVTAAHMEREAGVAKVTFRYEGAVWETTELYQVAEEGPGFFSRQLTLEAINGAGGPKLDGGEMYLGQASKALLQMARIVAPYYWPPLDQSLGEFAAGGLVDQSCQNAVTGVGLYLSKPPLAFAVGQYWERDWNRFVCQGAKGAVEFLSHYHCAARLRSGLRIPMGGQFVIVSEGSGWRSAVRAIGQGWEKMGFKTVPLPDWARSMALYSLFPGGTMGSHLRDLRSPNDDPSALRNFQRLQLPILKRLGVNAIWFLPLWPGLYGVSDYYAIDKSVGSLEDLRAVVQDAHAGGVRVLCDLIPHGPHESSGLAEKSPELVSRHEDGSILYWWGCLACDYAHPGWQEYMAKVATYWTKEADIDGWRVDCAGGAPPNWKPFSGNLPSWSGQWGGLGVMRAVREAMGEIKPEHVLLAESANPPMLSQAHFIYDWPAETILFKILEMPREQWVHETARWLDFQRLALPSEAAHRLMRFTENHDQLHSVWQLGPNLARPVWALMTLAQGFPLIYHEQEVGFEDFWAQLLQTRRALPELHRGQADYSTLDCDKKDVMAFLRREGDKASLVVISFAPEPRKCTVSWSDAPKNIAQAREWPTGAWLKPARQGGKLILTVDVPGGDWRVIALRSSRQELAEPTVPGQMPPAAVDPKPTAWQGLKALVKIQAGGREVAKEVGQGASEVVDQNGGELVDVTVVAQGGWRMKWTNGLLAGIACGDKVLADGMWLREGTRQVSQDQPVSVTARMFQPTTPNKQPATVKSTRWRVAHTPQGILLEWEWQSPEFTLAARYLIQPEAVIEADVRMTPRESSEPVIGQLYLALSCSQAERWHVRGLEGDVGGPFFVRHPTDREISGRYWHPIQRLWQHSVQPLSIETPAVAWQAGGQWVWLEMVEYPSDEVLDDIYLREYDPDGRPALTTYLEWMGGRYGHPLSPDKPFAARFWLRVGSTPRPRALNLPVKFWADGANWWVENDHYRMCIGRSNGGYIRGLWLPGHSQPLISNAYTYTDRGILSNYTDPLGAQQPTRATTEGDLEPDCSVTPDGSELRLRFRGYMRTAHWPQSLTNPRVQYETVWHFTRGPRIHVEHRARPFVGATERRAAFLAQTLHVPEVQWWKVTASGTAYEGGPNVDAVGRVLESRKVGKSFDSIEVASSRGKLQIDKLSPWGEPPQSVFLFRERDQTKYVLFLAMLCSEETELDGRWRGFAYDLQVLPEFRQ